MEKTMMELESRTLPGDVVRAAASKDLPTIWIREALNSLPLH